MTSGNRWYKRNVPSSRLKYETILWSRSANRGPEGTRMDLHVLLNSLRTNQQSCYDRVSVLNESRWNSSCSRRVHDSIITRCETKRRFRNRASYWDSLLDFKLVITRTTARYFKSITKQKKNIREVKKNCKREIQYWIRGVNVSAQAWCRWGRWLWQRLTKTMVQKLCNHFCGEKYFAEAELQGLIDEIKARGGQQY